MATIEIKRSLEFYEKLFREKNKLNWDEVCQVAAKFLPLLRRDWPEFCKELNGMPSRPLDTITPDMSCST